MLYSLNIAEQVYYFTFTGETISFLSFIWVYNNGSIKKWKTWSKYGFLTLASKMWMYESNNYNYVIYLRGKRMMRMRFKNEIKYQIEVEKVKLGKKKRIKWFPLLKRCIIVLEIRMDVV